MMRKKYEMFSNAEDRLRVMKVVLFGGGGGVTDGGVGGGDGTGGGVGGGDGSGGVDGGSQLHLGSPSALANTDIQVDEATCIFSANDVSRFQAPASQCLSIFLFV